MKLPSPFVFKIFLCSWLRSPSRLSDELATLGLDCGPRQPPDTPYENEGGMRMRLAQGSISLQSVYHVLGTMCIPCPGLDMHSAGTV